MRPTALVVAALCAVAPAGVSTSPLRRPLAARLPPTRPTGTPAVRLPTQRSSSPAVEAAPAGGPIKCKAAVAFAPKEPVRVEEVIVDPPKAGEVRVKVIANALCHTDIYTLDGEDPEGLFPCILGHEAGAVVVDVGEGVTSVAPGDHVIPCYTPECKQLDCIFCQSPKTNLCPRIRATQGKGVMPDGTSRFKLASTGESIFHFMGCSTFSEYTVLAEISCAKISPAAPLDKVCLLGCGVATGWGAVWNNCRVEPGSSVAVFGLGAVGLSVIQAAKLSGASRIFAIDVNPSKFSVATDFGATDCIDPREHDSIVAELVSRTQWGVDYTFDCTGSTDVMRSALEAAHRGWGVSCVIGVAGAGKEIATRPFQLVTGRRWIGTAFGGWKSRSQVPGLVRRVLTGELPVDKFITHTFSGVEGTQGAVDALHSGECLRAVVRYAEADDGADGASLGLQLLSACAAAGGSQKRFKHTSASTGTEMSFSLFLPPGADEGERGVVRPSVDAPGPLPAVLYLSGLTCTDENVVIKSSIQQHAARLGLAVICPDTSPRGVVDSGSWDVGEGAGFYVDATRAPYAPAFKMESYLMDELLPLCAAAFNIDAARVGVTGHSMGGHGALTLFLRHPGRFASVSAFAPICAPTECPWGQKAFNEYLGSVEAGEAHDASKLVAGYEGARVPILVDQGLDDEFLAEQLKPELLEAACAAAAHPLRLRRHAGYDHSYLFVASFLADHLEHHARFLLRPPRAE